MSGDFILEIGCEELPADYLPWALDWGFPRTTGLSSTASEVLSERNIFWRELRSFGTPRRLVLKVSGIEPEVHEEVEGPPLSVAFDAQGKPTRAAEAFAQKQGVKFSQLIKKETSRGPRLVLERSIPVTKVLALAIPEIVRKIGFPKTMRWDESDIRFARPIRWLLALYGSQIVPVALGTLKAGKMTYPNRRLGYKPVIVKDASSFSSLLPKLKVWLEQGMSFRRENNGEPDEQDSYPKKDTLYKRLQVAAHRLGGRLPDRTSEEFDWLLTTATFLAEDPVVEVGSFQKVYLDLPSEVLATSMAKHLKLFSVYDAKGEKLLPQFLAVLEGKPAKPAMVMANYDRIIEARFTDARFFYKEDTKTRLETKIAELAKVVFHEKLGTVGDRVPRLERLMKTLAQQLSLTDRTRWELERVAQLCKTDLVTQMVREFPSLQGIIGGYYAKTGGDPVNVADAIAQQYQPRTANDPIPSTELGALISFADRLDTLIGYFGVGLKPTGSMDPYGLRRQALGLVRLLIEFRSDSSNGELFFRGLSIDRLFDEGIQSWGSKLTVDSKTLKKELRAFLQERFEWVSFVQHQIGRELTGSVLAVEENNNDLATAWERLIVLRDLWKHPQQKTVLVKAAKVAERTGRIVKAAKEADGLAAVNPEVFKESSEKKLWTVWNQVGPQVQEQVKHRQYREAVASYSALYPEVHEFFETVFVMDENLEVRKNRLAFMKEIFQSLSAGFADLSKLPLAGMTI